jgi:hypothetical protein
MSFCTKCGTETVLNDDYCRKCGAKLQTSQKDIASSKGTLHSSAEASANEYSLKRNRGSKDTSSTNWSSFITIFIVFFLIAYFVSSGGLNQFIQTVSPPKVTILSANARSGFQGLNFVVYLDVKILCESGSGNIEVWSYIEQDTSTYRKFKSIQVSSGDTYTMTFAYPEATFWSISGHYRVWIEQ